MIFVIAGNYSQFTNYRYECIFAARQKVSRPIRLVQLAPTIGDERGLRYVGHPRELMGYRFDSTTRYLTRWERVKWLLRHWRIPPMSVEVPSPHTVRFVGTWRERPDAEELVERLRAGGWTVQGPLL